MCAPGSQAGRSPPWASTKSRATTPSAASWRRVTTRLVVNSCTFAAASSFSATAWPIPDAAPVTTQRRPVNSDISAPLGVVVDQHSFDEFSGCGPWQFANEVDRPRRLVVRDAVAYVGDDLG